MNSLNVVLKSQYNFDSNEFNVAVASTSTIYNAPVLKAAPRRASIEFQLIENIKTGNIMGRLFIPNELRDTFEFNGDVDILSDSAISDSIGCNFKSRTVVFTASLDMYKCFLDEYTNSNLMVNIVRTVRLLHRLELEAAAAVAVVEAAYIAPVFVADTSAKTWAEPSRSLSTSAYGFDAVPAVSDIDRPLKVIVAPSEFASLAQLKGCRSSFLKGQLRKLNVYGRSKLSTIASMAEVLNGRVAISDLPK